LIDVELLECMRRVVFVGHKRDSWFAIDSQTGTKVQTLSVDSAPEVCPSSGTNQMFIGRTGTCTPDLSALLHDNTVTV